ncbi:hypothetical protein Pelo_4933 [Pelomyxa schiedti]|nr:hypothetical protein Pelo_4933 [Pelomyxa schiedti]
MSFRSDEHHDRKQVLVLGDLCTGRNQVVLGLVGLHGGPYAPVQNPCEGNVRDTNGGRSTWNVDWRSKGGLVAVSLNDVSNMWADWNRPRYSAISDVTVLCFSLHSASSLCSISSQWFPEVWNNKRFTPVFLVGTNENPETPTTVPRQQCIEEAKRIGAVCYFEFNATNPAGAHILCNLLVQALERKIEMQGDRWEPFLGVPGYTPVFGLYSHVCTVYADRLYHFSGRDRTNQIEAGFYLELPPRTPITQETGWQRLPCEGFPQFPAYCTAMSGQLVYFFGGTYARGTENKLMVFDAAKSRLEIIKPAKSKAPPESYGGTLVFHNKKLYLFGGSTSHVAIDGLYEFDINKKVWKELPPQGAAPRERYHHSAYCKNGVMVVLCGLGNDGEKYNDVWAVDLATASAAGKAKWTLIPCHGTPPTPQRGHAGCLLNNDTFMFVGSSNANPQCELFHFDTNTFTWKKMEMQMSPTAREFFGITAWRNHIIITSGMQRSANSGILSDGHISVTPSLFPGTNVTDRHSLSTLSKASTLSSDATLSAFQLFPPHLWIHVTTYLGMDDICRLGAVSKELYHICAKDEVWKKFLPVVLRGGTGLRPLCIPVWKNPFPLVPTAPVSTWSGPVNSGCFLGNGQVLMYDGTTKPVCSIQPGDCVMTEKNRGRAVALVESSKRTNPMRLVFINGIGLTTGHPVWQQHQPPVDGHCGGEWVRACDHKDAVLRDVFNVGTLYNFVLEGGPEEPDHSVIINSVLVCTLGKDCGPVMREKYPRADMMYGTGYWKKETKE